MSITALAVALALAATDAPPPAEAAAPTPIQTFFHAADVNDFTAMTTVMDRSGPSFIRKVSSCYLRRVYTDGAGHVLATWMCAEGQNRSRVVIANVTPTRSGKVAVAVQMERTNELPAPERMGSAFAD